MKKLLILVITIITVGIINVNALDISIDSVKVKEKSNNLEVGEVQVEGLTLTPTINFENEEDFVTYEIDLKSNDKKAYQIKSITGDNNGNIKTTYTYDKDLSKPILLNIKYDSNGEKLDKVNLFIEVEEISNPKTGFALMFFVLAIILVWVYAILDKRHNKIFSIVLLLGLLFIPLTNVLASEKITLVLNGDNIQISEELRNNVFFRKMFVDSSVMRDEGSVVTDDVKLVGLTAGLKGEIGLYYYLEVSDRVLQDTGARMEFSFAGSNHTTELVYLKDTNTIIIDGKTYYIFLAGEAAKNIIDPIEAQFVLSDGTILATYHYSVKDYCDKVIENKGNNYSEEVITYIKAMLNYGGYSQEYHNYKVDNLANENIDKTFPEITLGNEFDRVSEGECEGITYSGSRVIMTSLTDIRNYFVFENDMNDYIFESNGNVLEVKEDSSGLYVDIKNIAPQKMREMQYVTISNKQNVCHLKIGYSVYSNIYRILNNPNSNESSLNVMKALYQFGESGYELFQS